MLQDSSGAEYSRFEISADHRKEKYDLKSTTTVYSAVNLRKVLYQAYAAGDDRGC